jgi:hypothetical protein
VRTYGQLAQARIKARAALPRSTPRAGDFTRLGRTAQVRSFGISSLGTTLARGIGAGGGFGGPRLITGDYNRSISLAMNTDNGNPVATIGTNRPQGRRLELGFVGVDARGRRYHQPPYPHFGPGLDDVTDAFIAAVADLSTQVFE